MPLADFVSINIYEYDYVSFWSKEQIVSISLCD